MVGLNIRFKKSISEFRVRKMMYSQTNEEIVEDIIEDYLEEINPTYDIQRYP